MIGAIEDKIVIAEIIHNVRRRGAGQQKRRTRSCIDDAMGGIHGDGEHRTFLPFEGDLLRIAVDPHFRGAAAVDDEFRAEQLARLSRFRLAGYDLEIVAPRYVPVDLAASVCVAPGFLRDDVERRLRREFTDRILPDGRRGFFHPDEFSFGQPLHLSRVVARMMMVPGVRDADFTPPVAPVDPPRRFKRWGRPQGDEVSEGRIAIGPLEIIRCDNDPNYPDNGRIEFFVGGGA